MGIDPVEPVTAPEEAFAVAIPNDRAAAIVTVGDATEVIMAICAAAGRPLQRADVLAPVGSITGDHTGTRLERLAEARGFVDDLGLA